ncbi:MAG: TIGR01777 family oxidoreductase [Desulfobacterales bacterium]|jgi:hypothetical protein
MQIMITGGTGFVGRELSRYFLAQGHHVTALGRSAKHPLQDQDDFRYISADTTQEGSWQEALEDCHAVINLAGATIFRRWTAKAKNDIRNSRILTTRHLVQALPQNREVFFFSASGVGYYGDSGDRTLEEEDKPGQDFLANLSIDWEKEALQAERRGARVAIGRFGVILHASGGALSKMLPPFKMGVGGPLGSGRQWFPWIHLEDVIAAIDFLVGHAKARGVFNFSAPEPVTNRQLARSLGRQLSRPAFFRVPATLMHAMLGDFSSVLLGSQRTIPKRLLDSGYVFQHPTLDEALKNILAASQTAD